MRHKEVVEHKKRQNDIINNSPHAVYESKRP